MKKGLLFILCLTFISAGAAFAQTRKVTNADLEKFREKRLAAEKDYRENYEKMGFPSPEELERDRQQSIAELGELSSRLRAERLERESVEAAREQIETLQSQTNYEQSYTGGYSVYDQNYSSGYLPYDYYNYGYSGNRQNRFRNSEYIRRLRQTDYINRRNGYVSPFRPARPIRRQPGAIRTSPNFPRRPGGRN